MIFVTLGTSQFQFSRLIRVVDKYCIESGEEVFIQSGYTNYKPKYCQYDAFLSDNVYLDKFINAELIIAHAGLGVYLQGLKHRKKMLLCPRLPELMEHANNHQVELAKELKKQGKALLIEHHSKNEIVSLVNKTKKLNSLTMNNSKEIYIKKLKSYIDRFRKNNGFDEGL